MKIAFLGKGGSGKSTLAAHAVRYLRNHGYSVLAIDADHNMDLSYNLGATGDQSFLGTDPTSIKKYIGVSPATSFSDALAYASHNGIGFQINPPDSFTASISSKIDDGLQLMTAGPHTDSVRFGGDCSHSLAAPLKVYLPLLKLGSQQAVVVDERAGTDPVATGILKGIDHAVIVAEPTVHSVKVACQISKELVIAGVAHVFVANKTTDNDALYRELPVAPVARVAFSQDEEAISRSMEQLFSKL